MSTSPPLLSDRLWRWVVEDAEPQVGTEDELMRQLATGRLPPYALVWREGWGEWLPAMQVGDLAEAFPSLGGLARSPEPGSAVANSTSGGSSHHELAVRTARPSVIPGIPPVPVSDYPRLRHLAKVAPLGWPDGFEGPEQEVITSEVPAVVLQEAARVMTQPNPPRDLGLQEAIERASRLPPERFSVVPADVGSSSPPERGSFFPPERVSFFPPERVSRLPERTSRLPPERSQPLPRLEERTPVSGPALPLAAELGLEELIAQSAPVRSWSQWLRTHGPWVTLLVVALGLGATFGVRWFGMPQTWQLWQVPGREGSRRATASVESTTAALSPSNASRAPVGALACRFRQPPVELDDWAVVDVRPVLHPLANGRQVAIGYAQSNRSATGGILDIGSLRLERQFWQQQDRQVFSVVPLEVDGTLRYHVERQGANLGSARAIAAEPPVRVGSGDEGIVIGKLSEPRAAKLWPLPLGAIISVPEVAEHPLGFTLALRTASTVPSGNPAAGNLGRVRVGLISSAGAALAPLADVGNPEWDLGRPALASGPEQTVLAVSRRGGSTQPDELLLARARNGQLPTELRHFELPAPAAPDLGPPLVAALPDGGFALMWSQGTGAQRQVRLQRLSSALQPLAPAVDVTPATLDGSGAATSSAVVPAAVTPAALHWIGDRLLAFYFSRREAGHSLWVGSIGCGG